jgi:hypothetical protein
MVRDLTIENSGHVFGDGPISTMGLHQDPLEQAVIQIDGPGFRLLAGLGIRGAAFLRGGYSPAPGFCSLIINQLGRWRRRFQIQRVRGFGGITRRRPLQDPGQS